MCDTSSPWATSKYARYTRLRDYSVRETYFRVLLYTLGRMNALFTLAVMY